MRMIPSHYRSRLLALGLLVAVFCLLPLFPTKAADTGTTTDTTGLQNPAEIYVRNLKVQGPNMTLGRTLDGTLLLMNAGNAPVSNVYYHVLVLKQSGETTDVYADQEFGPFTLPGSQMKLVNFSANFPTGLTGDMTVRVRAVLGNGFKMGWQDVPLRILGPASSDHAEITSAAVNINGTNYAPEQGPTVFPTDTGSYNITLKNTGTKSETITPTISIYAKEIVGSPVATSTAAAITIAAGKSADAQIVIPKNLPPGTYETKVEFYNGGKALVAPFTSFRFISGGASLVITTASARSGNVSVGSNVALTIGYTGTPADISGKASEFVGKASVKVVLTNESGAQVGEKTADINFDSARGEVSTEVRTTASARGLSADITVSKDGKTIAHYQGTLSTPQKQASGSNKTFATIAIVVLVIAIAAALLWALRKHNRSMQSGMMLLIALVGVSAFSFLFSARAEAFTITSSFNDDPSGNDWRPNVFVNSPYGQLTPGQQFYVTADVSTNACGNQPNYINVQLKYLTSGGQWTDMGTIIHGRDTYEHSIYSYNDTLSCGQTSCAGGGATGTGGMFTAPTAPGTYRVYLHITNDPYYLSKQKGSVAEGTHYGWVEGYQEFTVTAPASPPTVNLSANPIVTSNNKSTLTWSTLHTDNVCSASSIPAGVWSGNKTYSGGSELVSNITAATTFVLKCTNQDGSVGYGTTTVNIPSSPGPSVSLYPDSSTVQSGNPVGLHWNTSAVNGNCSATSIPAGLWNGTKAIPSGSDSSSGLTAQTTFVISCTNTNGTKSAATTTVGIGYATQSFDLKVERVGADLSQSSAPLHTSAHMGIWNPSGFNTFQNDGVYLKFEESPSNNNIVIDSTGNAQAWPPNNGGGAVGNITRGTGKSGNGITFVNNDSQTGYVESRAMLPDEILQAQQSGTISMWVRWNGAQPHGLWGQAAALNLYGVVLARTDGKAGIIGLNSDNANGTAQVVWRPYDETSNALVSALPSGVGSGWHHVLITFSPTIHQMYVDGTLQSSTTFPANPQMYPGDAPTDNLFLGMLYDHNNNNGSRATIDEFRVYRRVLTSSEIATLAGAGDVPFPDNWNTSNPSLFGGLIAPEVLACDDWGYNCVWRPYDSSLDYAGSAYAAQNYSVTVKPANNDAYDIAIGSCSYARGNANDCNVSSYTTNPSLLHCTSETCTAEITPYPDASYCDPNESGNDCSSQIAAFPGYVTKVSYKYIKKTLTPTLCPININNGAGWNADFFDYPNFWDFWTNGSFPSPWTTSTSSVNYSPSGAYYSFSSVIPDLQFPALYPLGRGNVTAGEHFSGTVQSGTAMDAPYQLQTSGEAWVYVNGSLSTHVTNGGPATGSIHLNPGAVNHVDVYNVQRGWYQHVFGFAFDAYNTDNNLYTPNPPPASSNGSMLVRRIGPDGETTSLSTGKIKIDTSEYQTNEQFLSCLVPGAHSLSVSAEPANANGTYTATVAACKYSQTSSGNQAPSECQIGTDASCSVPVTCPASGYCTTPTSIPLTTTNADGSFSCSSTISPANASFVENGKVTKVIFKYAQAAAPTSVGININSVPPHSSGPVSIPVGTAFNVKWTQTNATSCTISNGSSPITLTPAQIAAGSGTISDTITSCDTGTCNITYTISCSGNGTSATDQVVVKATTGSHVTPGTVSCNATVVNPVSSQTIPATQASVGQPITWAVQAPYDTGSYTYTWTFDGVAGTGGPSVVKTYSTVGQKTASVIVTGTDGSTSGATAISCQAQVAGGASVNPVVKLNPNWGQF